MTSKLRTDPALLSSMPYRLVLDTNVVLDGLVFRDPATRGLMTAVEGRHTQALVCRHTLDEFERVLAYPRCRLTPVERQQVLDRYVALSTLVTLPDGCARDTLLLPQNFPHCRDSDDQPFLALAYHARADALITKDQALLKLSKKVRRFGFRILEPMNLSFAREEARE